MKKLDIRKLSPAKKKSINAAEKSYKKMESLIKPFIKERKFKQYSTKGEWKSSSREI